MHALNLSWSSLFSEGLIDAKAKRLPSIYYKDKKKQVDLPCINFNDVDILANSGLIKSGKATTIVIKLIRMFLERFELGLAEEKIQSLSTSLYAYLGNLEPIHGLPKELENVSFIYPMELKPDRLREIYLAGGVFIMQDLSFYIKQLRLLKNTIFTRTSQSD